MKLVSLLVQKIDLDYLEKAAYFSIDEEKKEVQGKEFRTLIYSSNCLPSFYNVNLPIRPW